MHPIIEFISEEVLYQLESIHEYLRTQEVEELCYHRWHQYDFDQDDLPF
jgi:hypothetical protein